MLYVYVQNNASWSAVHLCAFLPAKCNMETRVWKGFSKLLSFNNVNAFIVFLFWFTCKFIADENKFIVYLKSPSEKMNGE